MATTLPSSARSARRCAPHRADAAEVRSVSKATLPARVELDRGAVERDRQFACAAAAVETDSVRRQLRPASLPKTLPHSELHPSGLEARALAAIADRDADPAVVVAPAPSTPFAAALPQQQCRQGSRLAVAACCKTPAGEAAIVGPAAEVAGAQCFALMRQPAQRCAQRSSNAVPQVDATPLHTHGARRPTACETSNRASRAARATPSTAAGS